jgi:hypothetical protein
MVTRMKVVVEIADELLAAAERAAAEDDSTVQALIDDGLRRVLNGRRGGKPFKLRDGRFRGGGMRPEYEGDRDKLLEEIYDSGPYIGGA